MRIKLDTALDKSNLQRVTSLASMMIFGYFRPDGPASQPGPARTTVRSGEGQPLQFKLQK
eukprot:62206-Hanusia_phi.AAC.2